MGCFSIKETSAIRRCRRALESVEEWYSRLVGRFVGEVTFEPPSHRTKDRQELVEAQCFGKFLEAEHFIALSEDALHRVARTTIVAQHVMNRIPPDRKKCRGKKRILRTQVLFDGDGDAFCEACEVFEHVCRHIVELLHSRRSRHLGPPRTLSEVRDRALRVDDQGSLLPPESFGSRRSGLFPARS